MEIIIIVIDNVLPATLYFYDLFVPYHSDRLREPYQENFLHHYSSGSTGKSKQLYRTQQALFNEAHNFTQTAHITAADNIFCIVPLFHAHGLGNCLLAAMYTGATLVILEQLRQNGFSLNAPFVSRCARVFELIAAERITVLPAVAYIFDALATASDTSDASAMADIRLCFTAGNSLPLSIFNAFNDRFGIFIRQLYGCTEAGSVSINLATGKEFQPTSAGKPIVNVDLIVVDEEMRRLPCGSIGEIAFKSPALTCGYHDQPDSNRRVFKDGYFLTGDEGKIDEQGFLYITGRKKIFIDTGGYKIDPLEVEEVLNAHSSVAEAIVVGVPASSGGELIKAVIVPKEALKKHEIFTWCKSRLADFKIPRIIETRAEIPKNQLGKILRKDLIEDFAESTMQVGLLRQQLLAIVQPKQRSLRLEAALQETCTQLLNLDRAQIDPHAPFGDFGLTSITALELKTCLEIDLEVTLPITILWAYPTIAELTSYLIDSLEPAEKQPEEAVHSVAEQQEQDELLRDVSSVEQLSDEDASRLLRTILQEEHE
jgi:long-chain acyl-CoA synthetase